MQKVIPALRITDYTRSKEFYIDGMGFQIDWEHRFEPHFPVFAQITKDEM
ncbi:glyoxalase superfamily protein, partial [Listeria monocytogenes]|nr:VOC family protein [Listeria monocytogenes]